MNTDSKEELYKILDQLRDNEDIKAYTNVQFAIAEAVDLSASEKYRFRKKIASLIKEYLDTLTTQDDCSPLLKHILITLYLGYSALTDIDSES